MFIKLLALLNITGQQQREEVSLLHISIKKVGLLRRNAAAAALVCIKRSRRGSILSFFSSLFLCRSIFFFFIHHHLLLFLHGSGAIVRSLDDTTLLQHKRRW